MSTGFSQVLSQLRKSRGLSQRQVAGDLKISQALLSHYENGAREPRLDFVVSVCGYYGVSADYLLGRTELKNSFSAEISGVSAESAETILGAVSDLYASADENGKKLIDKYFALAAFRLLSCADEGYDRAEEKLCTAQLLLCEAELSKCAFSIDESENTASLSALARGLMSGISAKEKTDERSE